MLFAFWYRLMQSLLHVYLTPHRTSNERSPKKIMFKLNAKNMLTILNKSCVCSDALYTQGMNANECLHLNEATSAAEKKQHKSKKSITK